MRKYSFPSYIDLDDSKTSTLIQTREFWEDKAEIYDNEKMTEAGKEKQCIFEYLNNIPLKDSIDIVSLGVATGCRDPKIIIEHLTNVHGRQISTVTINDIAESMLRKAYQRTCDLFVPPEPVRALRGSADIALQELSKLQVYDGPLVILGVYRSEYLPQTIVELYNKKYEILGRNVEISTIQQDAYSLVNGRADIKFKLPAEDINALIKNVEELPMADQVALRLEATNNGKALFTTTYFNAAIFGPYLRRLFPTASVQLIKTDEKNMVAFISNDTSKIGTIVSLLGGCFGNIPIDTQQKVLERLDDCFFKRRQ